MEKKIKKGIEKTRRHVKTHVFLVQKVEKHRTGDVKVHKIGKKKKKNNQKE